MLQGHAHTASQDGSGANNQLALDDTPGQGRMMFHTTQHQT